jgi:hypothetical protein
VNSAIDAIYQGGQSFAHNAGGGTHSTVFANLDILLKRKNDLENRLARIRGGTSSRLGAAW